LKVVMEPIYEWLQSRGCIVSRARQVPVPIHGGITREIK
jgi:hypothetical protein